jgi:hypothetical protein
MGNNFTLCEQWHQKYVVVVFSQEVAQMVWKLVPWLPPCYYRDVIITKGIVMGQRKALLVSMLEDVSLYLQQFWSNLKFWKQKLCSNREREPHTHTHTNEDDERWRHVFFRLGRALGLVEWGGIVEWGCLAKSKSWLPRCNSCGRV